MNTTTISKTQEVLAEMLTENTGRHMLDSGGAYGRNWERNQGLTVEDFINSAPAILTQYSGPVFNVFHYLDSNLEYSEKVDKVFQEFMEAPERKEETYFHCVYEWCEDRPHDWHSSFLTYNGEHCLSQEFQADCFEWDGDAYCCLSIHGGCDVRGGYTKPRVFRILSDQFGYNVDSYTIYTVDRKAEDVSLECRGSEVCDRDGSYLDSEDPLYKWVVFWQSGEEGYPIWDEDTNKYRCPDGDGYLDIEPHFLYE